jgi:uncharacterized protein YcbK (DUF882 family)
VNLTRHFRVEEFACRDGTPVPLFAQGQLQDLCADYLEPLRRRFGPTRVMSGYRTRSHNTAVGGAPASLHVYSRTRYGTAADVVCARGRAGDWWAFLEDLDPGGLGRYQDHVHVDNRRQRARW